MPRRSAQKNKIRNKAICKSAGLGGFLNSHVMKRCHNRNRVGLAQGDRTCHGSSVGSNGTNVKLPCK